MARTDNLNHFLTDVASAIRYRAGTSGSIAAADFDTEIENIPSSGSNPGDFFNGDYASTSSGGTEYNFFREKYIKSNASLVPIDCTGKATLYKFFQDCRWDHLPKLKNTGSVTTFEQCFSGCTNATSLDLSAVDTSSATGNGMASMFYGCQKITSLDLSGFDFSGITSLYQTFYGLISLTSLNLGTSSTPLLTNMASTFANIFYNVPVNCTLDLSNFDLSNVTTIQSAFTNTGNTDHLTELRLPTLASGRFFSNKLTNMNGAFYGRSGLTSLPVGDFDTSNVTDFQDAFRGCYNLVFPSNYTLNIGSCTYFRGTFNGCSKLKDITITGIKADTTFLDVFTNAFYSFNDNTEEGNLKFIGDGTGKSVGFSTNTFSYCCGYYGNKINIEFDNDLYFVIAGTSTSASYLPFYRCSADTITVKNAKIKTLNILAYNSYVKHWRFINCDWSDCNRMYRTWYYGGNTVKSIEIPDFTGLEPNNSFQETFYSCTGLELLDIRGMLFSQGAPTSIFDIASTSSQIPANCVIVVKDDTEKAIFTTALPRFTNVMTVAEYEAQ